MSNEKADEFLSWRTKLTPPEALPEQGLDNPEAVWQQLYARLDKRPRRRFLYGYRLAAACLLLALIPAALLFRGRTSDPRTSARQTSDFRTDQTSLPPAGSPAGDPVAGLPPAGGSPADPRSAAPPTAGVPFPAETSLPIASNPTGKTPATRSIPRPSRTLPASVAGIPLTPPPATSNILTTPDLPTSSVQPPQLAQRPPARRILKAVSINELDNPTATEPTLVLRRPPAPFRIRLQSEKGLTREASADRAPDPQFLQLKIPLQNP
ncbi:MAG TPA: hypothetical protein VGM30_08295 [Puia sp.]|jgi:hypothetical protein